MDIKNQDVNSFEKTAQDLLELLDQLSLNEFKTLAEELIVYHEQIFGRWRTIKQKSWSLWWIQYPFRAHIGREFHLFYIFENSLRKSIDLCLKGDKSLSVKEEICSYINSFIHFFNKPRNYPRGVDESKIDMYFLTGNRDTIPQGRRSFANFLDEIDYWRQNIAIFRSSLIAKL